MAKVERIPMIPQDPAAAFEWVLTHVIGLDTAQKRSRITVLGAVTTIDNLLLVNIDRLLECLTDNTTVMSQTRLQTLKQWAEEQYDMNDITPQPSAVNIK